jgi:hypothetical protein
MELETCTVHRLKLKTTWRRATLCNSGSCVEVAGTQAGVAVRDSKQSNGPLLHYTADEWRAFVRGVKAGEFDEFCASDN